MTGFTYDEFVTRNIGFVTAAEQERLRGAHVFIGGVGGMGGAAITCLARTGVGRISLADIDVFEVSNLNRQIVATMETVGQDKAAATVDLIRSINPECEVTRYGAEWVDKLDEILPTVDVAINGCDDARATIGLMRAAAAHGRTVIDAFAAPLPNVYVVGPKDPRPEVTFGYPTVGRPLEAIDAEVAAQCLVREIEWVLVHSTSVDHVVTEIATEMIAGTRKRISFAPMVWATGCFMAYEAVRVLCDRPGGPGPRGVFLNPWTWQVERPRGPLMAAIRRYFVRRFIDQQLTGA